MLCVTPTSAQLLPATGTAPSHMLLPEHPMAVQNERKSCSALCWWRVGTDAKCSWPTLWAGCGSSRDVPFRFLEGLGQWLAKLHPSNRMWVLLFVSSHQRNSEAARLAAVSAGADMEDHSCSLQEQHLRGGLLQPYLQCSCSLTLVFCRPLATCWTLLFPKVQLLEGNAIYFSRQDKWGWHG